MSKFCQNCGGMMEDQEVFCGNCGAQNEVAPAPKGKLPILIGAGAGALALIIILIAVLGGNSWKKAFNNYIDVNIHGKFKKVEKLAPKEYWEYYEDEYDEDIDDVIEEYEDDYDDMMDELEDEYGKRIKVTLDVEKKKTLKKKKVEKIAEALEEKYDINEKSVKKIIEIKGEMTIKGSEDDDDEEVEFTFAKIRGKWYMINYGQYDGEYYAYFVV